MFACARVSCALPLFVESDRVFVEFFVFIFRAVERLSFCQRMFARIQFVSLLFLFTSIFIFHFLCIQQSDRDTLFAMSLLIPVSVDLELFFIIRMFVFVYPLVSVNFSFSISRTCMSTRIQYHSSF